MLRPSARMGDTDGDTFLRYAVAMNNAASPNKKKLLIDMTVLAQGTKTGVYRVADELVRSLLDDPEVDVYFTLTREEEFARANMQLRPGLRRYCRENNLTAGFINADIDPAFTDIDIYLSPFFPVPEHWAEDLDVKKVVMAYDLIPLLRPEYCEEGIIQLLTAFYGQIKRDWQVLAISETTRRDLINRYPHIPPKNVHVTYLGADERFRVDARTPASAAVRDKYGIPRARPYVLSVATLEVRKNLEAVIEGFHRYIRQNRSSEAILVLTGMKGWKLDDLSESINRRPGLADRVVLTGFVDDGDLPALYAGASVFAFMSFYEGFGLPPLEAMSCGIPVITSNRASLPEVVGDAGIMLEPDDVDGFAESLQKMLGDPATHARFAQKSVARACGFSWRKFRQQVSERIHALADRSTPSLSIITICYNETDVRDTCESIRKQTFSNFEWIVIDGGSGTETLGVLNEFRSDMTVFVSEKDEGRYDAMNKGIRRSRGKYLLFLNAGDYLHDARTLERVFSYAVPLAKMDIFNLRLNAPVVYGEVVARETGMFPHPMWKAGPQVHDLAFFRGNSLPHQATFIRRDLFLRYGLYDASLGYAADYEWFIRTLAFSGEESQYVPIPVSVYNFDGVSSTSVAADAPHILEIQRIYQHYSDPGCCERWNDAQIPSLLNPPPDNDTCTDLPDVPRQPDISVTIATARRLLTLAGPDMTGTGLRELISECNSMICQRLEGRVLAPMTPRGGDQRLADSVLTAFLQRLSARISSSETENDRVPYWRTLLWLRESLIRTLEANGLINESRDDVPAGARMPGIPELTADPDVHFSSHLGLAAPSLREPEHYHVLQNALRGKARAKFRTRPSNRGYAND